MTVCMKARYGIALAMAAGFIAMPAQAQYTGPSAIGDRRGHCCRDTGQTRR